MKLLQIAAAFAALLIVPAFSQTVPNDGLIPLPQPQPGLSLTTFDFGVDGQVLTESSPVLRTFPSVPGRDYYISIQVKEVARLSDATTLWMLGGKANPKAQTAAYQNEFVASGSYSWVIRARSTETFVEIGIFGATARVTGGLVASLQPSPFLGKYVGTAKKTASVSVPQSYDTEPLVLSKTVRASAKVLATGQIVLLAGADEIAAGMLFSDGTFVLQSGSQRSTGTVEKNGSRLKLTVLTGVARDEGQNRVGGTSLEFTLTRSSKP